MGTGVLFPSTTIQSPPLQESASICHPAVATTPSTHQPVASLAGLFASLIVIVSQSVTLGGQPVSQPAAKQAPPAVVHLTARASPAGEGIVGQESEEAVCAYYVDTLSDDEEGATVEALVDDMIRDLELLFQEQLTALAEDAAEQEALRKGKAVVMGPSPPQDRPSIMVLREETEAAPTRPDELITQQPRGGSRWYIQCIPAQVVHTAAVHRLIAQRTVVHP